MREYHIPNKNKQLGVKGASADLMVAGVGLSWHQLLLDLRQIFKFSTASLIFN
jgi:hypothetical protein